MTEKKQIIPTSLPRLLMQRRRHLFQGRRRHTQNGLLGGHISTRGQSAVASAAAGLFIHPHGRCCIPSPRECRKGRRHIRAGSTRPSSRSAARSLSPSSTFGDIELSHGRDPLPRRSPDAERQRTSSVRRAEESVLPGDLSPEIERGRASREEGEEDSDADRRRMRSEGPR